MSDNLRYAVASLCDALKRLERSVEDVADPEMLEECKKRRKSAERVLCRE